MSILHSLRRSQQIPETHFFWKKLSVSVSFRFLRKKNLDIQRKKIQDCPNWIWSVQWENMRKNVFFGVVKNLHNFLDCDGNTFKNSAKNGLLSSPNCLVRVQTKDLNEVTFFRSFQFWFFFQKLSGKYPAVLSKTNSTRREERMKHEVLNGSSLIA